MTKKTGVIGYIRSLIKPEKISGLKSLEGSISIKLDRQLEGIVKSPLLSRDLSWLTFNERVLDQARRSELSIFEKLKFLAITASNLDEFFNVRIGSLYNYIDYGKERVDHSGLRERPFRMKLLSEINAFYEERNQLYRETLAPQFRENGFDIVEYDALSKDQKREVNTFFDNDVFPMLTPMVYDQTHAFPILLAKNLILGVVTKNKKRFSKRRTEEDLRLSFVQVPSNLPKFYSFTEGESILFVPTERVIMANVQKLYRNVKIESVDLFRILRNADYTLEETDDMEADFVDEIKQKIKERKVGRLVSIVIENEPSAWMMSILKKKWEIDDYNIFVNKELIDFTRLWQIINHPEFKDEILESRPSTYPLNFNRLKLSTIFKTLRDQDVLLHHPYNNFEPVLQLIEKAAEDPQVMSIKLTIYRLAKNSRITKALLRAVENGKHVSALFEIKARFDEENNIKEAEKLQKAGCFVIYGIGGFKTHTKLMLIVRKEGNEVVQYAHMASGNYNEETAKLYTDIGILTSNPVYTKDISEFFNVITGHSEPQEYQNLITSPRDMRKSVIELIRRETEHAKAGKEAGICIKVNSLEDKETIFELYEASRAGVKVELIVRGICCLRPGRAGLSENIRVKSIVGHYLEHARIFYFRNDGNPKVFGSSADIMVRSFDRRIESIFEIMDGNLKKQMVLILKYNLKDNVNSYALSESGQYHKIQPEGSPFNLHEEFFNVTAESLEAASLDCFFCKKDEGEPVSEKPGAGE